MTEHGAQYDHIGSKYDEYARTATLKRAESATFFRMVGTLAGQHVLDLACGFGFYTRLLKQRGAAQVVGVDIAPEMIRLAQQQAQAEPLGITYQVGDAVALPHLGRFDLVTAVYLLNYAESKDQMLAMCRSAYNNLVTGGRFIVYTVNPAFTLSKPNSTKYGVTMLRQTPDGDRYLCDMEFVTDPPTPYQHPQWNQATQYWQWLSQAAPDVQLHHLMTGYWISAALGVAAELHLADLMADGARASADLARSTGSNPAALYRLLWTLASAGLFTEVEPGHFALTEMGDLLHTDHPQSLHGLTRYICGDRQWRRFGALRHSVETGQPADQHVFGVSMRAYWEQHPEERAIFDAAMRSTTAHVMEAVVRAYDFSPFRTVVDVGGGHGVLLAAILDGTPGLRGILFDLPEVAEGATSHLAAAGVLDRCEVVGGDMFIAVPNGGDAYVLSRVIHARDDARAVAALASCRRAMGPTGTLLVVEEVLPPGDAPAYGKLSDLNMLVGPGGQERAEAEYRTLYTAAGFVLTQVIPTPSRMSIIVGVPREGREA